MKTSKAGEPMSDIQAFEAGDEVRPALGVAESLLMDHGIARDVVGIVEEVLPGGVWTTVRWPAPWAPDGCRVYHLHGTIVRRDGAAIGAVALPRQPAPTVAAKPSQTTENQPFAVGTEVTPDAQAAKDLSIPPDIIGIVEGLHPAGYWTAVRWPVQWPSKPNGWLVNHPPGMLLRREAQPAAATEEAERRAREQFPDAEIVDGRILVGVLVVERGSEFAAVLVRKRGGRAELPSGKAMVGESAVDAAAREGREELGVPVRIVGHVGDYDHEAYGLRWRVSTFAGALVDGDRLVGSAEGPARWVSRDEITDRPPGDDLPARILAGYDAWAVAREAT